MQRNDYNENNNNNSQIKRLSDFAFRAFLRAREEIDFEIPSGYNTFIEQKELKLATGFLQAIANANPVEVKKFLDDCPELAVAVRGTVTTASGHTYENYSAIELACVMDDDELAEFVLLPAIKKLPQEMIKKAYDQLTNKMAEIEKQHAQFKPYDFIEIVKAIDTDQSLRDRNKPNEVTQKAFAQFKENLKPGNIREGKSWVKQHLQEAYRVYSKNYRSWELNQLLWYLIHVIGHLQTLVEKCFEQECSQGLVKIVNHQKPNARKVEIYLISGEFLNYRETEYSDLILSRDYFVDIAYGKVGYTPIGPGTSETPWQNEALAVVELLENSIKQKQNYFANLQENLNQNQRICNSMSMSP